MVNYASLTSDIDKSYVANGVYRYGDAEGTASVDFINYEKYVLTGGSGNDRLYGADQADKLTGNDGNDLLDGYRGADIIDGGNGDDTWVGDYSNATAALTLNVTAAGNGTLVGAAAVARSIENFTLSTGAGNDTINLTNSQGNDILSTGNGDDTIDVGRGSFEQVDGGIGIDDLTLDFGGAGSSVRMEYYSNGWWHAISATGDYEARFINVESFDITGSSKADRIQGFAGNDALNGAAGSDIITGNEGGDSLTGGTGNDQFYFGAVWTDGQDTITDATAVISCVSMAWDCWAASQQETAQALALDWFRPRSVQPRQPCTWASMPQPVPTSTSPCKAFSPWQTSSYQAGIS